MAWTGVLGLVVESVTVYASVHGSKLYVFWVQRHFCIFMESLPYTHMVANRCAHAPPTAKLRRPTSTTDVVGGGVRIRSGGTELCKTNSRDLITVQ
jgi:hypothetical protein